MVFRRNEHSEQIGPPIGADYFSCLMEKPVGVSEIRTRNFWAQNQALSPYDILGRRVRPGKRGQAKYRAHQMSTLDYSVRTYEKEQISVQRIYLTSTVLIH